MLRERSWKPPRDWQSFESIDMHTGGEPLRVITRGIPVIPGSGILEKRRFFRNHYDHLRTMLMWEPRGHADMYGAVITEPCSREADFGTFFLHNEGYSTGCGHAIIALVTLVLETGMIRKQERHPTIGIDAPSGFIRAKAFRNGKRVEKVCFQNVPSFVLYRDRTVDLPGIGPVRFDVAYGGAFYAICRAEEIHQRLIPENVFSLIQTGRRLKEAVSGTCSVEHPLEKDLSFLYGTIFVDRAEETGHHSRNVCVFADGEVDRSATGTGVSARAALHFRRGELELGEKITIESILGTTMDVEIIGTSAVGRHAAVIPEVTGSAFMTGKSTFFLNPKDPLAGGFFLR